MTDKKSDDKKTGADISESLEQVFLAGLGALSAATEVGAKTFDSLVDQGEAYRQKASKKTEEIIEEVQEAVREVADSAQERATGLFDQVRETTKVEGLHDAFDRRVEGALARIRVATQKDVEALNARIDTLIDLIEAKEAKPAPKKRAAKKAATKKTTTKKRKVAKKKAASK